MTKQSDYEITTKLHRAIGAIVNQEDPGNSLPALVLVASEIIVAYYGPESDAVVKVFNADVKEKTAAIRKILDNLLKQKKPKGIIL